MTSWNIDLFSWYILYMKCEQLKLRIEEVGVEVKILMCILETLDLNLDQDILYLKAFNGFTRG
jgi:hypothetical protein